MKQSSVPVKAKETDVNARVKKKTRSARKPTLEERLTQSVIRQANTLRPRNNQTIQTFPSLLCEAYILSTPKRPQSITKFISLRLCTPWPNN